MDSAIGLAESIRTISSDKLQRTISISRMKRKLIELFVDRTKTESPLFSNDDKEEIKQVLKFNNCLSLNDERTIAFNQGWKQEDDVFDESRQIWISGHINPIEDDVFIPRDDVQ